jgi:hypothetical protein
MLDIILGSHQHYFSIGELLFFPVNGIQDNEFCSCGSKVHDCAFWSNIIHEWSEVRTLTLDKYIEIQLATQRNKRTLAALRYYCFPSSEYKLFLADTKLLYDLIFSQSQAQVLIDSSKIPQRLLMLRKLGFPLQVLHLNRSLTGVLYSTGKELTMDPAAGIEKTIAPQRKGYVISSWLVCNCLIRLFSIGLPKKSIRYEHLLAEPEKQLLPFTYDDEAFAEKVSNNGPFVPGHLVAGGRIRMKKSIHLDPTLKNQEVAGLSGFWAWFVRILDRIRW